MTKEIEKMNEITSSENRDNLFQIARDICVCLVAGFTTAAALLITAIGNGALVVAFCASFIVLTAIPAMIFEFLDKKRVDIRKLFRDYAINITAAGMVLILTSLLTEEPSLLVSLFFVGMGLLVIILLIILDFLKTIRK